MDTKNPLLDLMLPIHQSLASWVGMTPQFGLVNINQMATEKPELEREIVEKVGSYGMQLGRVIETLELVMERSGISDADLESHDAKVREDFQKLARNVKAAKKGYTPVTDESVTRFLKGIEHLEENDPSAYEKLRKRLLKTLKAGAGD